MPDNKQQIQFETTHFVYDQLAPGLVLNILVGGALLWAVGTEANRYIAVIWYCALVLVVLLRLGMLLRYRMCTDKAANLLMWRRVFIMGAFAMGGVWGAGGALLCPPDDAQSQVLVGLIVGGMIMGAVPYLAPLLPAYLLYALAAELPFAIHLFSLDGEITQMIGLVSVLFMSGMMVAARLNQRNFMHNLQLRLDNQDLLDKLHGVNSDLEKKIQLKNKVEKDLRENEARFKALSDAAHDGVIIHLDGIVIEANEAVSKMVGFSLQELMNISVVELVAPEARDDIVRRLAVKNSSKFETIGLRRDGSTFEAEISAGDIVYYGRQARIVSIRDISKHKQIESELMHATQVAEAADRLKSEFLAAVSHELRTPLNAVLGFMQILEESPLNEEQQRYLQMGEKAGNQLLLLINDLLDLSRIESGHFQHQAETINLNAFLYDTIQLIKPNIEARGIQLKLEMAGPVPEQVVLDPERLRQVLLNLLGNAIKFSDDRAGRIRLVVSLRAVNDGAEQLYFEVHDNGIGIPADKQKAIFKRFSQLDAGTSRKYGGAGLGLAISRELVTRLGGQIGVISEVGQGSTFWFTLPYTPASDAGHEAAQQHSDFKPAGLFQGVSVLVVEDEEANQIIMRHIFEKMGCRVEVATNGQEAVALEKTFDLIFMDMQMPVMDGLAATQALRQNGVQTPIIAMTANAMPEDRRRCLDSGMNDYLSKPIVLDELPKLMERWLGWTKRVASV